MHFASGYVLSSSLGTRMFMRMLPLMHSPGRLTNYDTFAIASIDEILGKAPSIRPAGGLLPYLRLPTTACALHGCFAASFCFALIPLFGKTISAKARLKARMEILWFVHSIFADSVVSALVQP